MMEKNAKIYVAGHRGIRVFFIFHHNSIHTVFHNIWNTSMICCNNKHSIAHCFQNTNRLALVGISSWKCKKIAFF